MTFRSPFLESHLVGLPRRAGKVRDVHDLGDDRLLIVATDRISAFDWVLPTGIPDKGRVLTQMSAFWFERLGAEHHLISTDLADAGLELPAEDRSALEGRVMIVRKAEVIPFECVVRGALAGSGWKEYRTSGTVCGEPLPPGLLESSPIEPPIFTPATKAETGHDENIAFATMAQALEGQGSLANDMRAACLRVFEAARRHTLSRGLILADTKFEMGWIRDRNRESRTLAFVDEVLTPDSSRYWPAEGYRPGGPQPSFDKQFVRDWLETSGWDKQSPPPPLPRDVVARTRAKYIEAFEMLTGRCFPWN